MFNPAEALRDNPALFACYILFVYFRGRNAVRIEREMRSLGYSTFHRRNLYPRGSQPGWIGKFGWQSAVSGRQSADGSCRAIETSGRNASVNERGDRPPYEVEKEEPTTNKHEPTRNDTNQEELPSANRQLPTDFHAWLKRVSPTMTWNWRHQQVIIDQLKKVTSGDCKRLMIFLPPRHGKSELVSVRYTAWRMQQDPSMNVILGSYNQRLADRMSRKIRTVICDAESMDNGKRTMDNAGRSTGKDGQTSHNRSSSDTIHSPLSTVHSQETVHSPPPTIHSSPFPFSRPRPKNAVSEWETATGGSFRAVGAGSGVTGFGANLIVIDDPVKNRAQAESETYRNRVWDWYKDDLYTRLEPDGSIVLIQTRWHEDDLAGRLLRDDHDKWTIINLPALAEEASAVDNGQRKMESEEHHDEARLPLSVPPAVAGGCSQPIETEGIEIQSTDLSQEGRFTSVPIMDMGQRTVDNESFSKTNLVQSEKGSEAIHSPLSNIHSPEIVHSPLSTVHSNEPVHCFDWRQPGEALCPDRFPVEALDKLRTQLGTYSFSALYQQRPTPAGGQIFKREWFKNIIDFAPPGLRWTRGYDLAVSTRTESDYTASFRVAFDKQGNLYIAGGFRRRIEFPEQRRYIIDRITNERDTQHGVELALHGQALLQDLRRDPALRGKSLRGVKVSTDKLTRALTWSPIAEDGKVILVRSTMDSGQRTVDNASATDNGQRTMDNVRRDRTKSLSIDLSETECPDTEISPRTDRNRIKDPDDRSEIFHSPLSSIHSQNIVHSPLSIVSWIDDLLDELTAFPNGTHDDQIDAISIAVQMHAIKPNRAGGFLIT